MEGGLRRVGTGVGAGAGLLKVCVWGLRGVWRGKGGGRSGSEGGGGGGRRCGGIRGG